MPGGGYRPGAGRPRSRVKAALQAARGDPLRQVELASQFLRDRALSVGELVRVAVFLANLVHRLERRPAGKKAPAFRVVRRTSDALSAVPPKP